MTHRSSKLRLAAAVFFVFATGALSSACTVPHSTRTQYVVQQKAYVQSPRGPAVTGPLAEEGEVGLEGSAYGTARSETEESRLEGAPGHIVLDRGLSSRFVVGGLDRLEIGVGGSMGHSELSSPGASDLERSDETSFASGSIDAHMRFRFVQTDSVKLYLLGELSSAIVPFKRRVDVYEQRTTHGEEEDTQFNTHHQRTEGYKNRLLLLPAGGVGATVFVSPNAFVSFGGYGQDMPVFFGRKVTVETCENPTGEPGDEQCSGREADDLPPVERTFVGTAFGGFGVRIDKTTLKFQGFYHGISKSRWNEQAPGGGRVAIRYRF